MKVKDNAIDKALSQFKRKVKNSGLLKELRDREYYEKPSIRKRNKRKKRQLRAKYSDWNKFLIFFFIFNFNKLFFSIIAVRCDWKITIFIRY